MKRRCLSTLLLVVAASCVACPQPVEIVTLELEPRDFIHRVEAEGLLVAAVTTDVKIPPTIREKVRVLWLAEDGGFVEAGEVVARFDAVELQERFTNRSAELESNSLQLEKAESTSEDRMAQVDKDYEVAGLELGVASQYRLTDEEIFSRIELLESQLDAELAEDRRASAKRSRPVERDLAEAEKELLLVARRKVQIEFDKAQRGLSALEVTAPHSGIFQVRTDRRGEPLSIGALGWPGMELGQIPDLGRIEAEVYVLEADAGGLEVGRPARLRLASSPGLEVPATIKRVDPVAQRRQRGSPLQFFGVTLSIQDPPAQLKPGLRVEATLELARVDQAIVVPRQAVFLKGGAPHVWRRIGGQFEAVPVELGAQTAGSTVVESGLEPGDRIALEDPRGEAETRPTGDPGAPEPGDAASSKPAGST